MGALGQHDEPAGAAGKFQRLHTGGIAAYSFAMSVGRKNQTQDDLTARRGALHAKSARKTSASACHRSLSKTTR